MLNRSLWGVGDQTVNSLSSLVFAIMVARIATPLDVGAWAIAYAVYTFVLTVNRAAVSTTALIDRSADSGVEAADSNKGAATLGFGAGAASGAVLVLIGLASQGTIGNFFIAFGCGMPVLLVQDSIRYWLIRQRRTHLTAIIDAVWIVIQVSSGLILSTLFGGVLWIVIGWVLGAALSAALGLLFVGWPFSAKAAVQFASDNRATGAKLLLDSLLNAGTASSLPLLLGAVLGLAATGYFRGGLTLVGVVGIVTAGLTPIATVEILKRVYDPKFTHKFLAVWSGAIAAVGIALCVSYLIMSDSIGTQLLGETWFGTRDIIFVMALQVILRGPLTGVQIVLRSAHELNASIRLRVAHSINVLLLTIGGALVGGLGGAAWAWMFSGVVGSGLALITYRRFLDRQIT